MDGAINISLQTTTITIFNDMANTLFDWTMDAGTK